MEAGGHMARQRTKCLKHQGGQGGLRSPLPIQLQSGEVGSTAKPLPKII